MRHESKFSTWIRTGGQSSFVLPLTSLVSLETKFSVVPDRLLDSIIDDALAAAVTRLNQYLPSGISVDISAVDLSRRPFRLTGDSGTIYSADTLVIATGAHARFFIYVLINKNYTNLCAPRMFRHIANASHINTRLCHDVVVFN